MKRSLIGTSTVFRQRVVAESIAQARQYLQGESP